ncbi:MAG TPA: Flp pilus assembly protein CpaB, partial [Thermodesulfobacteriota bacterium]|nr:Flp pilus assembly protein CpaB [Thermodesulfobacteriota bacterium]
DVLVTVPKGKTEQPVTKMVLENVLVLAAGSETEIRGKGKEEKPAQVDVITLEVNPADAERLALASTEGKIQLALRNFTDTENVQTRGTSIPTLLSSYTDQEPKPAVTRPTVRREAAPKPAPKAPEPVIQKVEVKVEPPPPPKKATFVVEVIKGSNVSVVKFE